MEFQITKMEIPAIPEFNHEELKQELLAKTEKYNMMQYSDAEIWQAKKDRADLNKLKKAINDERIRREKEYMKPFNEFKAKVNEIIDIIDKPIQAIDGQIKEYEKQQTERKHAEILQAFADHCPFQYEWLKIEQIFNNKWLNSSVSMKSVVEDMQLTFDMIESELKSIETLDYKEQALQVYKETLSMSKTLERVSMLKEAAKIQAEETASKVEDHAKEEVTVEEKQEEKADDPKEWMQMEICLNSNDFDKFDAWTKANNIEWRLR